MKMQDEQLRELFQQKLSGHESPVNPSLWNNIQSGIGGQSAGAVATAAKTGFLKIASIVSGIVITGGIVGYYAFSKPSQEEEVVAQKTEISSQENTEENESKVSSSADLSESKSNAFVSPPFPIAESTTSYRSEIEETPVTFFEDEDPGSPSDPEKSIHPDTRGPEKENGQTPEVKQDSKNEDFSTEFNVVGTSDMGLLKMLIPVYTEASSYRWTIDHGDAMYYEMSTTHDFGSTGEHHILLEIEKTPGSGFTEFAQKTICVCPSAEIRIDYDLFTPNGDYYSRVFDPKIQSRNILPTRLLIFEKSTGKQIFEGFDENAKWDGTGSFGQEFPSGQYFYQFSATDLCGKKLVDKTGFIELQR